MNSIRQWILYLIPIRMTNTALGYRSGYISNKMNVSRVQHNQMLWSSFGLFQI